MCGLRLKEVRSKLSLDLLFGVAVIVGVALGFTDLLLHQKQLLGNRNSDLRSVNANLEDVDR